MAVGGIVLFAYEDRFASTNWIGIVLSLGSAIGAALYKVLVQQTFHVILRYVLCAER